MAHNLRLGDPSTIKKYNYTLHTSFVKREIYQNIHYINNQDIYPPPTNIARDFDILERLITRLMHVSDKKFKRRITGRVKWSL